MEHVLPFVPGLIEALQQGIDGLDVGRGSGHALTDRPCTNRNSKSGSLQP